MVKLLVENPLLFIIALLVAVNGCLAGIQERKGQEDYSLEERHMIMQDAWPKGCISCHRVTDDDKNIGFLVNQEIEGHPVIDSRTLKECMDCHRSGEENFVNRLHVSHMKSRKYIEYFHSNCLGCHQMNNKGKVFVKGLE